MSTDDLRRFGNQSGDQPANAGGGFGNQSGGVNDQIDEQTFRRPSASIVVPAQMVPPPPPAPPTPNVGRPQSGIGRGLVVALFILGTIGGGVTGSLMTLVLSGGTATVQLEANLQPIAVASGQSTAARPEGSIAAVARQVTPAVVTVRTREGATPRTQSEGEGSGFIVDRQGHILTNNHVIVGANRITVILSDGTQIPATVIGTDPSNDLAVLRADIPSAKAAVAVLGDSEAVQPGDMAIAIGAPFGLDHSVTAGIISAVKRDWAGTGSGSRLRGLIQTDAPVNPGNSGGPLLNAAGEVIGINNAIEGPIRGSVGIGFAIPINLAKRLLPQLSTGAAIEHPWLGISGAAITPDLTEELRLGVSEGVIVFQVLADSPAAKAGLKGGRPAAAGEPVLGGDIITKVDGKAMKTVQEIAGYLDTKRVGDAVNVTVLRDGQTRDFRITLGKWPEDLVR